MRKYAYDIWNILFAGMELYFFFRTPFIFLRPLFLLATLYFLSLIFFRGKLFKLTHFPFRFRIWAWHTLHLFPTFGRHFDSYNETASFLGMHIYDMMQKRLTLNRAQLQLKKSYDHLYFQRKDGKMGEAILDFNGNLIATAPCMENKDQHTFLSFLQVCSNPDRYNRRKH